MYTPDELEQIVIDFLNVPALTGVINGVVCRQDERPAGSDEDVTVSVLTSGDGDVQRAFLNVKVYCKDVDVESAEIVNQEPNTPRFKAIVAAIVSHDVLRGNAGRFWKYGNLWIVNISSKFKNTETREHFVNIRIQMKVHLKTDDAVPI